MIEKIVRYLSDKSYRFSVNAILGFHDDMSDEDFLRETYRLQVGEDLNLDNPVKFAEKIQWLKIHDRKPEYNLLVDKYEVKKIVGNIIGEQYIVPTLGLWENFDDIDFDALPDKFVLKCTHDSGGIVIVDDKTKLNRSTAKRKLNKHLKRNLYRFGREWVYKDVPPRLIAEKYLGNDLSDYKFFCFSGEPKYCQVIASRWKGETIDFFDMNWAHQEFVGLNPDVQNSATEIPCPKNFELMKKLAAKLAKDTCFRRIDFYEIDGAIYFGEITFFPRAGFGKFKPDKWNKILGDMIILPRGD